MESYTRAPTPAIASQTRPSAAGIRRTWIGAALLGLVLAPPSVAGDIAVPAETWTGGIVASIRTDRRDPFAAESLGELGFLVRMANRLHAVTWDRVVRDLLIFEEGEFLTPDLAREAGRVLRRTGIFRDAAVHVTARADSVDVVVRTVDSWSTQLIANYSRAGDDDRLTLGGVETNILGSGDALFGVYRWSDVENLYSVGLTKRRVFTEQARLDLTYTRGDATDLRRVSFGQRDFADINRFAVAVEAVRFRGRVTLYDDGENSGKYSRRADNVFVGASVFWPGVPRLQVGGSVSLADTRNRALEGETLEDEWPGFRNDRRRQITVGAGLSTRRFVQRRYVNGSGLVEDIPMGALASIVAGAEFESLGSTADRPYLGGRAAGGGYVTDDLFASASLDAQAHWRDGVPDGVTVGFAARAFRQTQKASMTALRVAGRVGYDFEPEALLYLGARNGLRGFPFRTLRGTRIFVANLDERLALPMSVAGLEPDVVLFADAGGAWPADESVSLRDVRSDVGLGLRIHSPQFVSAPLRIDLGRGLGSGGDWQFTLEVGQFFSVTQPLEFRIPGAREFGRSIE